MKDEFPQDRKKTLKKLCYGRGTSPTDASRLQQEAT